METMHALFEYATEGIIISDESGCIIRINPSAEKLFGYDKDELLLKKIEELVPKGLFTTMKAIERNSMIVLHPELWEKELICMVKKKTVLNFH